MTKKFLAISGIVLGLLATGCANESTGDINKCKTICKKIDPSMSYFTEYLGYDRSGGTVKCKCITHFSHTKQSN